jgi:coiled-coil domain-containing protein 130
MQGFNMGRYHPPDSLDKSLSNRAGSKRSKNASKGPPTVRFEMPFAIWCTNCQPEEIIGQGVRFNAHKTRVGNYHSTPIWSFEMRHGPCEGVIEIRTDPAIGDYVVENGGRKRDYGDAVGLSEIGVDRERKDGGDPFAGVEGRTELGIKTRSANAIIGKLQEDSERKWKDPFRMNQRLRKPFRVERKLLKEKDLEREEIADRLGLGFEILDGTEEDGNRAKLIDFGNAKDDARADVSASQARPLFEDTRTRLISKHKEKQTEGSRPELQRRLQQSTRALQDPFLVNSNKSLEASRSSMIAGLKRKRSTKDAQSTDIKDEITEPKKESAQPGVSLVGYDSNDDSDG